MKNFSFVRSHEDVLTWILQVLLALLFIFAGATKLAMPAEAVVNQIGLPAPFIRFIAVCEIAGALGLILPGRLGISPNLTPLAATGLFIIMIGAVGVTAATQGLAPAAFPFVVGILLGTIVRVHVRTEVV